MTSRWTAGSEVEPRVAGGSRACKYHDGGLGLENVITTEAFQGLDFLPRQAFLAVSLPQRGVPRLGNWESRSSWPTPRRLLIELDDHEPVRATNACRNGGITQDAANRWPAMSRRRGRRP